MTIEARKAGPKRSALDSAQISGAYPADTHQFVLACDEYRRDKGRNHLAYSDYLHILVERLGYRPPSITSRRGKLWRMRARITPAIEARFNDSARYFGLRPGHLLERLVAWYANLTPRRQAEVTGLTPHPHQVPDGPDKDE